MKLHLSYKLKNRLLTGAVAACMGLATASASAFTVDGVTWNPTSTGNIFGVTSIYENTVSAIGQTLTGYGAVTQINGVAIGSLCSGCELTFSFQDYLVTALTPTNATFSGGTLNMYADFTPDFNPMLSGSQPADLAAATNGSLWLSLAGHTGLLANGAYVGVGTLVGSGALLGAAIGGNGVGLLDVAGGPAGPFMNTNSVPDGLEGFADFDFTASFSSLNHPVQIALIGSGDFRTKTNVPEPGTLLLLGIGLAGLGFGASRQKRSS